MGRFSGLGSVRSNMGGVYFLPGSYVVQLDEVKMIETRKGEDAFIVGGTVLTSTNPERPAGDRPSQVILMKPDILATCLSNIKQFAGAALELGNPDSYVPEEAVGLPLEQQQEAIERFWDETLEYVVSDEQPLKDVKIHLSCSQITTKGGKPFTKHIWGPVVNDVPAAAQG